MSDEWTYSNEAGRDIFTWKDYTIREVRQAIAASYINRREPPLYSYVWTAFYRDERLTTQLLTVDELVMLCQQHDAQTTPPA